MNTTINASFEEVIELVKDNISSNLNCHNIGRVIDYDSTTNTVNVELMQLKQWYNETITPVQIWGVPLINFGNKQARITVNPVGSYCVLLFMDRNFDNFMETGEQHLPDSTRFHNISDCVALLTINSNVDDAPIYDENALTVYNNNSKIQLYDDSVYIANSTDNLGSLISDLITAINDLIVVSTDEKTTVGKLSATTKSTLSELQTKFTSLLKKYTTSTETDDSSSSSTGDNT